MSRPKLLDLFSGAGGAAAGYHRAGFEVTGVDIAPQPRYPFAFVRADALEYVREHGREYDAIHASPPCQAYCRGLGHVNARLGRESSHPTLIPATREALRAAARPYVIENVEGAPLVEAIRLCGSTFGLGVRRHRLFECSFWVWNQPCQHHRQRQKKYWTSWRNRGQSRLAAVVQVYGHGGRVSEWAPAMGIDWMGREELAQAIPPAYTAYIGAALLDYLRAPGEAAS